MLVAPFKAADTSDILIHAVIPAAVRYSDRTRNHKYSAALCPEIGFQYQKLTDGDHRLLNRMPVNPVLSKVEEEMCTGVTVLHNIVH